MLDREDVKVLQLIWHRLRDERTVLVQVASGQDRVGADEFLNEVADIEQLLDGLVVIAGKLKGAVPA